MASNFRQKQTHHQLHQRQQRQLVRSSFEEVANLIRNSSAQDGKISDSIRLKLYGFYKCATDGAGGDVGDDDARKTKPLPKRPSIFDPIGRAKYDAWMECRGVCDGDRVVAMLSYMEVVAWIAETAAVDGDGDSDDDDGDSRNGSKSIGRKCADICHNVLNQLKEMEEMDKKNESGDNKVSGKSESMELIENEKNGSLLSKDTSFHSDTQSRNESHQNVAISHKHPLSSSSSTRFKSPLINPKSLLPPPLIPRGQLDISFIDLFYALWHCLLHAIYTAFADDGLIHRCGSMILPSFVMTLIHVVFSTWHPEENRERWERKIEERWFVMETSFQDPMNGGRRTEDAKPEAGEGKKANEFEATGAVGPNVDNVEAVRDAKDHGQPEVIVGLSVRSLLDLYLSAKSYPTESQVVVVPPVNIPGMVDVMRYHGLELVPVDIAGDVPDANNSLDAVDAFTLPPKDNGADNISMNSINLLQQTSTANDCHKNSKNKMDDMDDMELIANSQWVIDPRAVRAAITRKTVAILVVHPFGVVIAAPPTMKELRCVADEFQLDVWEDCAQCYTGTSHSSRFTRSSKPKAFAKSTVSRATSKSASNVPSNPSLGYTGSEYANVCFFSFGTIKTATALGGGLAVLRVPHSSPLTKGEHKQEDKQDQQLQRRTNHLLKMKEIEGSMRRIQDTNHAPQTNVSYFIRVLKCLVLHSISQSRRICGAVKLFIEAAGLDYDEVVVSLLRGFPGRTCQKGEGSKGSVYGRGNEPASWNAISQLRERPCPALLALLHRRLLHSEISFEVALDRLEQCLSFETLLVKSHLVSNGARNCILPKKHDGSHMYCWLFPILVRNPQRVSRTLLQLGFDAPCGMTQLQPVVGREFNLTNAENAENVGHDEREICTRVCATFRHILYLPLPCRGFPGKDQKNLVRALGRALSEDHQPRVGHHNKNETTVSSGLMRNDGVNLVKVVTLLVIAIIEWRFSMFGFNNIISRGVIRLACRIGCRIGTLALLILACLLMLSQYMGPIYLRSSKTFSKYCDMIFRSPFPSNKKEKEVSDDIACTPLLQTRSILKMELTKIPVIHEFREENLDMALVTGATGFIGSLLLRELLLHREALQITGGVAVIVRSKRGKSAKERMDLILSASMFNFLADEEKLSLIRVFEGDVGLPNCGMHADQVNTLYSLNISHVFHCAAAVSFSQSLEDAAASNITSSLQMQTLTRKLRNKSAKFVYFSTAFVHGGRTGTSEDPLPEGLFSLYPYKPENIYASMLGTQSYASASMTELGFPNTYTFSKCVCEHLLLANKDHNTVILRPSIVGPSVQEPFEGWAGEKPSTIVAAACLYLKFPYNMWCFGKELVPFVPVDVVCRVAISKSFNKNSTCSNKQYGNIGVKICEDVKKDSVNDEGTDDITKKQIITVAWDVSSPLASTFSWIEYAFTITHLGAVCGHVNRVIAYGGLLLSTKIFPQLNLSINAFQRLHSMLVRLPVDSLLDLCDKLPYTPKFVRDLKVLSGLLDLPILFFPFANQSFYFKSDLASPSDFNGERYMFSCAVAAHEFIRMLEKRANRNLQTNMREYDKSNVIHHQSSCSIVVAGTNHLNPVSDLLWALTQPRGSIFIRFGGWLLSKVFRLTATEIEVDIASFAAVAKVSSTSSSLSPPHLIIAPTHRSFYDFLIVSFFCFALPELGLDIPFIAAASDFADIPIIGWLASKANAFFVERGKAKKDPGLKNNLIKITNGNRSACIEVFIEGKRSRHRTFIQPKTGFLKCLAETGGNYIFLPLTINYEGLPDQISLMEEANCVSSGRKMSLQMLMSWMSRAISGKIKIGRMYISAADVLSTTSLSSKDIGELSCQIQSLHKTRILVSRYHTKASSLVLDIPEQVISQAILKLGCTRWPEQDSAEVLSPMPNSPDLLWAAMLHFGHVFAPYFQKSLPIWSFWLYPSGNRGITSRQPCQAVDAIVAKLAYYFGSANEKVESTIKNLSLKGFSAPSEKHVMQYLPDDSNIPIFLMQWALTMRLPARRTTDSSSKKKSPFEGERVWTGVIRCHAPDARDEDGESEAFGAWGYRDSYFVLNILRDGSKVVMMKGDRYSLSGKELPGLVKFMEEELGAVIRHDHDTLRANSSLRCVRGSDLTEEDVIDIVSTLGNDTSRVSVLPTDRARHGTGHTQEDIYSLRSENLKFRLPDAVAWPQDVSEVQSLVDLASQKNWCIIPFGGGTNVTHATHCPARASDPRPMISVDMKMMRRVIWVNIDDGLAHVEAGITGRELVKHVKKLGFTIGHEPDSYEFSTLGGWIATKASGMKQNKYGNIEDIVKEVTVVGTRSVISNCHSLEKISFGRVSTGIDLKSLFLGSEGCLGIITSAVIKIWPIPETRTYDSVLFPNFKAGLRFVRALSKMPQIKPASVRLLDNAQFRLGQALREKQSKLESFRTLASKQIGQYLGKFQEKSVVCATLSFEGRTTEVRMQQMTIKTLASTHGGLFAGSKIGKAAYDLTFAIAYLRDFAMSFNVLGESFETFVPWSKLPHVVEATKQKICSEHRNRALPGSPFISCRVTQIYDEGACVYFYFCMDVNGVADPSTVYSEIEASARQEILYCGGSLSHHHGLGKLRSKFVPQIYSEGYMESLFAVKKALDPNNTFGARNGALHFDSTKW